MCPLIKCDKDVGPFNCHLLVSSLQQENKLSWEFMTWWKKLMEALIQLEKWEINYCYWSINQIADVLSKLAFLEILLFTQTLPPKIQRSICTGQMSS